jgi:hypothetical protein
LTIAILRNDTDILIGLCVADSDDDT